MIIFILSFKVNVSSVKLMYPVFEAFLFRKIEVLSFWHLFVVVHTEHSHFSLRLYCVVCKSFKFIGEHDFPCDSFIIMKYSTLAYKRC